MAGGIRRYTSTCLIDWISNLIRFKTPIFHFSISFAGIFVYRINKILRSSIRCEKLHKMRDFQPLASYILIVLIKKTEYLKM